MKETAKGREIVFFKNIVYEKGQPVKQSTPRHCPFPKTVPATIIELPVTLSCLNQQLSKSYAVIRAWGTNHR